MATNSKNDCLLKLGDSAPRFDLPGIDGKNHSLSSFEDKKVLVVIFSCNHCPYVLGWEGRLMEIQREYESKGVQLIAINANETKNYPEDSFDKMVIHAKENKFNFIYLRDEDQSVAKAYDAACTPEVYVFDAGRRLRYHGRVDDNYKDEKAVKSHDLKNALDDLLNNQPVKTPETPALGCSIKWG
jgi:peroxiredoxin